MSEREFWLCGSCMVIADARAWGGSSTSAICPRCNVEHYDDDSGEVWAGTYIEMEKQRRELTAEPD